MRSLPLALALLGFAGVPIARAEAPPKEGAAEEPGPDLSNVDLFLRGPDGKPKRLLPYLGKRRTLVNLWATWCKPCQAEMPLLSRLHQERQPEIAVVGISVDEDVQVVKRFLKAHPVHYPVLFGSERTVQRIAEIPALPATLILDAKGRFENIVFGALDERTAKELMR